MPRFLKILFLLALGSMWVVAADAANQPDIQSLVGREFRIQDDRTGQELAFIRKNGSIRAVWRILGSGRPVLSEKEYPIESPNPKQAVFEVQLRDGTRGRLKIELEENSEPRAYLNGLRLQWIEKTKPVSN